MAKVRESQGEIDALMFTAPIRALLCACFPLLGLFAIRRAFVGAVGLGHCRLVSGENLLRIP